MDEELNNEEEQSIWDMLAKDDDELGLSDKYSDYEEEADRDVDNSSKMERKLAAKMDDMQKKFDRTILRERVSKFEESADDLQKDLFRTIAADVKDPESFDKAMALVDERYKVMKQKEIEYNKQMEERAAQMAASAWGTGPVGTPSPRTPDYEKEQMARIAAGDEKALFHDLMDGNWPT